LTFLTSHDASFVSVFGMLYKRDTLLSFAMPQVSTIMYGLRIPCNAIGNASSWHESFKPTFRTYQNGYYHSKCPRQKKLPGENNVLNFEGNLPEDSDKRHHALCPSKIALKLRARAAITTQHAKQHSPIQASYRFVYRL